jgi:fructose-bisphosphate aldolase/2-amino-3,7-dideoxy-D-threo-hept-6-ulosonate synthase
VAMNVFIGSDVEAVLIRQFAEAAETCDRWGMPLIAMINPTEQHQFDADHLAYVSRVGADLGADIIKTDYPGSPEAFRQVVAYCPVPVLVEEGPLPETEEATIRMACEAIAAGGGGVMLASRVWAHPDPAAISSRIAEIVHGQR